MKKLILIMIIIISLVQVYGFSSVRKNNKAVALIQDTLLYNAEEQLKEYLEDDSDNPILNYNYGVVKLKQFEVENNNKLGLESAIASFEKAKADTSKSNQQSIYYNQGNAYYNIGDYPNAINNYQESSTFLDSTNIDPDLLYNYANSLYKFAEANTEYDSLFTMAQGIFKATSGMVDSKHRQKIMHNLGNVAFQQENYQEAISYYIESLKLNPNSEDTRINYEVALRKLAEQQSQDQQQDQEQEQQEENSDEKQEQSENEQQSQQKQEEEAKEKQEQYDKLSEEEKEKLEAEKKLDALLQQQARPEENEDKPTIRQQKPTGRYW